MADDSWISQFGIGGRPAELPEGTDEKVAKAVEAAKGQGVKAQREAAIAAGWTPPAEVGGFGMVSPESLAKMGPIASKPPAEPTAEDKAAATKLAEAQAALNQKLKGMPGKDYANVMKGLRQYENPTDQADYLKQLATGLGKRPAGGSGYAAPTLVPRQWREGRWYERPETEAFQQQVIAGQEKMLGDAQEIAQAQLQTKKELAIKEANALADYNREKEAQNINDTRARNEFKQELAGRQAQLENWELRPDRVFADSSIPFRAGFLIKAALDGAIAGFTGRPNEFGAFADRLIKMDQDKQFAVLDKLKRAEAGTKGRMADYEKSSAMQKAVQSQAYLDKLTAFEQMLKTRMSEIDAGTPDVPGAVSTMSGVPSTPGKPGLKSRSQMIYQAAMNDIANQKLRIMKEKDAATVLLEHLAGGGGGGPKKSKVNEDRLVKDVNGRVYEMRGEEEARAIRKSTAAMLSFERQAEELDQLRSDWTNFLDPKARARMEQLGVDMMFSSNKMVESGVMDKNNQELIMKKVGDPTGIFSYAGTRGKAAAADLRKNIQDAIHGGLGENVEKEYSEDSSGNMTRSSWYKGSTANPKITPSGFKGVGK